MHILLAALALLAPPKGPVITIQTHEFGPILAARNHLALYTWTRERRDHRVHCTGACAGAWPPLLVRSRTVVAHTLRGVRGTFGTIRRPNGALQVTHDALPLYTYHADPPGRPLCNDVDGWFVVRT